MFTVFCLLLASAAAHAEGKHFLWRVSKGTDVMYLAGSVHALRPSDYPLPEVMEKAFHDSSRLVEEIDLTNFDAEGMQLGMYQLAAYPDGQSLKTSVPPDLYAKVANQAKELGMDMGVLDRLHPWFVSTLLQSAALVKSGYAAESGVDAHFATEARAEHKPVIGLEQAQFQMGLLARLSDSSQQTMLLQSVGQGENSDLQMRTMVDAWQTGDSELLGKIEEMDFSHTPDIRQAVLVTRNATWMPKLETMLASGTQYFVVVGALHLVGPDGLLARFEKDGYKVEQL